jgi:hypothetical protein
VGEEYEYGVTVQFKNQSKTEQQIVRILGFVGVGGLPDRLANDAVGAFPEGSYNVPMALAIPAGGIYELGMTYHTPDLSEVVECRCAVQWRKRVLRQGFDRKEIQTTGIDRWVPVRLDDLASARAARADRQ